jgi:crotonobetainyl-CoA:carnitine CoA-transferase CaiB-like acyl-CoA transferase
MLLADLGADVIKIERPPGGDPFRGFAQGSSSSEFEAHNRNKRSVTLDYMQDEGRDILLELVKTSDVAIVNSRPGVADRKQIGAAHLQAANPRLIYCAITGFGDTGPYVGRPAFDTVGQALSGWLSLFHTGDDPRIPGPAICDMVTGIFAAYGILGALYEREKTGRGRRVDVNMVDAMLAFASEPLGRFFRHHVKSDPYTRAAFSQAFVFRCADERRISIHMSSPEKFWEGLLAAVERPELAHDPRFSERTARVRNYAELGAELRASFAKWPRAEWIARLERCDVPFAPVYEIDELQDDPQVGVLSPFVDLRDAAQRTIRVVQRRYVTTATAPSTWCRHRHWAGTTPRCSPRSGRTRRRSSSCVRARSSDAGGQATTWISP